MPIDAKQRWEAFVSEERAVAEPWLRELGYELEKEQPHLGGERYLMQAVTTVSGRKLILLGRKVADGKRVVMKVTNDPGGMRELEQERTARAMLPAIRFAYQIFLSPEELVFEKRKGHLLSIQAYIEQDRPFLSRPIEEQFTLALEAFKAQEGAHAATYEHGRQVRKTLGTMDAPAYLEQFRVLARESTERLTGDTRLTQALTKAEELLEQHAETIERYTGFLTHTDFVPHNIRVKDGHIYLLDHSSLRFGNKYEGWARFLNFMMLYHPELERAFVEYVRDNRTPEESLSLRLMRIYRLVELIRYYAGWLDSASGDLLALTQARLSFWTDALVALLDEKSLGTERIEKYKQLRDQLRSDEERRRQQNLH